MKITIDITEHEWEYLNKLVENGDQLGHYERLLVNGNVLEQKSCEDCISRKDIYFKLTNGAYSNETIEQFIDRLVKELEALPSVTPKPKTGHWIRQTDDYHDYYECEHCGIAVGLDDIKNYCPNCGAKMESEVEDADSN